jgi:hypothetical protein
MGKMGESCFSEVSSSGSLCITVLSSPTYPVLPHLYPLIYNTMKAALTLHVSQSLDIDELAIGVQRFLPLPCAREASQVRAIADCRSLSVCCVSGVEKTLDSG